MRERWPKARRLSPSNQCALRRGFGLSVIVFELTFAMEKQPVLTGRRGVVLRRRRGVVVDEGDRLVARGPQGGNDFGMGGGEARGGEKLRLRERPADDGGRGQHGVRAFYVLQLKVGKRRGGKMAGD